jgi:hypothetical protein
LIQVRLKVSFYIFEKKTIKNLEFGEIKNGNNIKDKSSNELTQSEMHEVKNIIEKALDKLYTEDLFLISASVNERSIAFRLGLYIEQLKNENTVFKNYHLDSKYNKNKDKFKKTPAKPNGAIPDLILHKRGNNWNNLMIIEIKRPNNYRGRNQDIQKLIDFTNKQGNYKYEIGIFIILGHTRERVKLNYYIN